MVKFNCGLTLALSKFKMAALFLANVRKERVYRKSEHLERLSEEEMRSRYRFGNASVDFLEDLLGEDLIRPTLRGHALSVSQQILMALRFYSSGNFLEVIGDTMGYNKGTVSRAVDAVTNALLKHFKDIISWPSEEQKRVIKISFFMTRGLPNIVGCIDGTHVRIQAPSEDEVSFVNRKGYHSINIQVVCDHKGKFTSFCASWPGSSHDSHVFRTSGLRRKLEETHRSLSDGILLGDSGYPCRPFLLTPFINANTPARQRYQEAHTRTRVTIERTFGRWKRRFHVMHSEVRMEPGKECRIASACAILHNLAMVLGEPDVDTDDDDDEDDEVDDVQYNENMNDGQAVRNHIVDNFFT